MLINPGPAFPANAPNRPAGRRTFACCSRTGLKLRGTAGRAAVWPGAGSLCPCLACPLLCVCARVYVCVHVCVLVRLCMRVHVCVCRGASRGEESNALEALGSCFGEVLRPRLHLLLF